jgi:hypothetical protein
MVYFHLIDSHHVRFLVLAIPTERCLGIFMLRKLPMRLPRFATAIYENGRRSRTDPHKAPLRYLAHWLCCAPPKGLQLVGGNSPPQEMRQILEVALLRRFSCWLCCILRRTVSRGPRPVSTAEAALAVQAAHSQTGQPSQALWYSVHVRYVPLHVFR